MLSSLPHLNCDPKGTVWIDDSGYRVLDIAREHLAHGWSAEALQENHPDLSLAQLHAALAWYYDHEEEMRQEMIRREEVADALFAKVGESPLQKRFRQLKAARH